MPNRFDEVTDNATAAALARMRADIEARKIMDRERAERDCNDLAMRRRLHEKPPSTATSRATAARDLMIGRSIGRADYRSPPAPTAAEIAASHQAYRYDGAPAKPAGVSSAAEARARMLARRNG
jgi:hypothetical protein